MPQMQRDRWRGGYLAREALRNVFDIRSRMFALVVLALLAGVGTAAYSAWESSLFQSQLLQDAKAGRNVLQFSSTTPSQPVHISRQSCEELTRIPGVIRAGILVPVGTLAFPGVGADLPTFSASQTLFPELKRVDVIVGDQLKRATASFNILMPDTTIETAIVGATQPVGIDVNSSVVTALSPSTTSGDQCLVVLSKYVNQNSMQPVLSAGLRVSGGAVQGQSQYRGEQNPIFAFLNRPGQFLPLLLGVFGGLAAGIFNRLRGSELAAYRLSGTSVRSLEIILTLEQAALAGTFIASSVGGSVVLFRYEFDIGAVGFFEIAAGCAWVVVASLTGIDVAFRRPTSLANER
jgi:hypothetical protein